MRKRSDLTSIQINWSQKETIDQAYERYMKKLKLRAELGEVKYEFVSKGRFLEILCNLYVLRK